MVRGVEERVIEQVRVGKVKRKTGREEGEIDRGNWERGRGD